MLIPAGSTRSFGVVDGEIQVDVRTAGGAVVLAHDQTTAQRGGGILVPGGQYPAPKYTWKGMLWVGNPPQGAAFVEVYVETPQPTANFAGSLGSVKLKGATS